MAIQNEWTWIQSEEHEKTRIGLVYEPSSDPYLAGLNVRVETDGLDFEHWILVSDDADGLVAFFADLVENWRGWRGIKRWEALEHGMTIEASHAGRIVELVFSLRRDYKPDAWEVRVPIVVTPGEAITRVAQALARAFPDGLLAAQS
jgi:Family of unknown function (DUF6228)